MSRENESPSGRNRFSARTCSSSLVGPLAGLFISNPTSSTRFGRAVRKEQLAMRSKLPVTIAPCGSQRCSRAPRPVEDQDGNRAGRSGDVAANHEDDAELTQSVREAEDEASEHARQSKGRTMRQNVRQLDAPSKADASSSLRSTEANAVSMGCTANGRLYRTEPHYEPREGEG